MVKKNRKPSRFADVIAQAEEVLAAVAMLPPPAIVWTPRGNPGEAPREPGDTWVAGIEPWLVDDGAYGPLVRGREIGFALHVEPLSLVPADVARPRALALGNDVHRIEGIVIERDEDTCVIDFGLLGFVQRAPEWMRPGTGITGEVALEPDPDAYRAGITDIASRTGLIYPWRIDRIVMETVPRVPASPEDCLRCNNPALGTNSPDRRAFREIRVPRPETDWPPGEMLRYYLHCTLLSRIPRMPDARDRHPRFADPSDA